jgi:hypothetical protein
MKRILQFLIGLAMLIATRFSVGWHGAFVRMRRRYYGVSFSGGWPFRMLPVIAGGTDGMSSQGTYIQFGDSASPNTFTEVAEVSSIGGPNEDSEELDMTHLRSTGGYREFLQSFKDAGELALTMNFIPSNATQNSVAGVRSLYQSGAVRGWKINFPDGTTCTFDAYVKAIGQVATVGQKLELNVTLRITGATVWDETP